MSETAAGRKAHTRALGHKQVKAARTRAAAYRRHAVAADRDRREGIVRTIGRLDEITGHDTRPSTPFVYDMRTGR